MKYLFILVSVFLVKYPSPGSVLKLIDKLNSKKCLLSEKLDNPSKDAELKIEINSNPILKNCPGLASSSSSASAPSPKSISSINNSANDADNESEVNSNNEKSTNNYKNEIKMAIYTNYSEIESKMQSLKSSALKLSLKMKENQQVNENRVLLLNEDTNPPQANLKNLHKELLETVNNKNRSMGPVYESNLKNPVSPFRSLASEKTFITISKDDLSQNSISCETVIINEKNESKVEPIKNDLKENYEENPKLPDNQSENSDDDHIIEYKSTGEFDEEDFSKRLIFKSIINTNINTESLPLIESFQFVNQNEVSEIKPAENEDAEVNHKQQTDYCKVIDDYFAECEKLFRQTKDVDNDGEISISSIEGSLKGISLKSDYDDLNCQSSSTPLIHLYPKLGN